MKLHIVYITGLGDNDPKYQKWAVKRWQRYGVQAELFQMNWADKQPWEEKYNILLARIDEIYATGQNIGLIGASAGGSAAINAFAARKDKIVGVVLVAGKINRPEAIGQNYRTKNPAFLTSARACARNIASLTGNDKMRILSRYALVDELVHKADSKIDGAHNQLAPTFGHVFTIAIQLIFGAKSFIAFLSDLSNTGIEERK